MQIIYVHICCCDIFYEQYYSAIQYYSAMKWNHVLRLRQKCSFKTLSNYLSCKLFTLGYTVPNRSTTGYMADPCDDSSQCYNWGACRCSSESSHTSRDQWAHQVTAAALFILLHSSYDEYQKNTPDGEQLHFDEWCNEMASEHPQFDYRFKVWKLELPFLQFLRSQRQQNFVPNVESLGKIIPWMFALDHYNYARWMTVHVRDLLTLEVNSPTTHATLLHRKQRTSSRH